MGVEFQHWLLPADNSLEPSPDRIVDLIDGLRQSGWILGLDERQKRAACARESLAVPPRRKGSEWSIPIPHPLPPAWLEERAARDLHLSWPMVEPTVKDAFQRDEPPRYEQSLYGLNLQISGRDQGYVYRTSEAVSPFESTDCACGESLEFEIDGKAIQTPLASERIHTACPSCGEPFEVSSRPASGPDTTYQIRRTILGGMTSRFALSIYCGNDLPYATKPSRAGAKRTTARAVNSEAVLEPAPGPALKPEFIELCERALDASLYEVADENC